MSNKSPLFRGKYHTGPNRLREWDYGSPGYYFVTICTKKRIPWFGKIQNDKMVLSISGAVVSEGIEKIENLHRNIKLHAWVVMPNHVHAIIEITEKPPDEVETPHWGVSTERRWRSGVLGVIINQFKMYSTKRIRSMGYADFAWQPGYYDHIIRSEKSLENINLYILANPEKWNEDEYYSKP